MSSIVNGKFCLFNFFDKGFYFPYSLVYLNDLEFSSSSIRIFDFEVFSARFSDIELRDSLSELGYVKLPLYESGLNDDVNIKLANSIDANAPAIIISHDVLSFISLLKCLKSATDSHYVINCTSYTDLCLFIDFMSSLDSIVGVFYLSMDPWFYFDFISMASDRKIV